jgi:hypothetical protein
MRATDPIRSATGWRWVGIYSVGESSVENEAWSGPGPSAHRVFSTSDGLTGAALSAGWGASMSSPCTDG